MDTTNPICIHDTSKKYSQSLSATFPNPDSFSKKIWNNEIITWHLETDAPTIKDYKLEEKSIKKAMGAVGWLTPLKHRMVGSHSDALIKINYLGVKDEPYFKKHPSVLAFAYGPSESDIGGDITMNADYLWTLHGKPVNADTYQDLTGKDAQNPNVMFRTWDAQHTLTHENYHAHGVPHIEETYAIMNPYYNGERVPQKSDMQYIQRLYGKAGLSDVMKNILLRRLR